LGTGDSQFTQAAVCSPKVNNQTGGYGENSPRTTPFNQHGPTGSIEPASPQPNLKGHNAAPHTKRP